MNANSIRNEPEAGGALRVAVWSTYKPLEDTLRGLVRNAPDVAAIADLDGQPLAEALCATETDVLVLDVDGLASGAADQIRALVQAAPGLRIVALSAQTDRRFVERAFAAGARAYVLKDCAFEDLTTALHALAGGLHFRSPAIDAGNAGPQRRATKTPE